MGGIYAGPEGSWLVAPRGATSNRRVLEDGSCPCASGSPADRSAKLLVKRRILIFYHIFVSNQWVSVVEDQVAKLVYSGLYHEATAIVCGIAGASQVRSASAPSEADCCSASFALLQPPQAQVHLCWSKAALELFSPRCRKTSSRQQTCLRRTAPSSTLAPLKSTARSTSA